ncbi:MAG TPA: zinc-binding alcohol dehydrogenase family protein [Sedimentisphaerales bacterium]|nr:zinc-binding alcohol dehydrogenase family protein [Sedimentisphaerales bacterium]
MKAVRIVEPGRVEICDMPQPKCAEGQVLIKVRMVGLCGSDLTTFSGRNPMVAYPRIPGHEIAGEIADVGKGVSAGLKKGLLVTVSPYTACGKCYPCRVGRANCCRFNETMGVQRDGAATEYIVVPESKVHPTSGLSHEQTACVEPVSVGCHAVNRGRVTDKDTVLVFGCGVIGLGAVAAAAYKKAVVIAVDIDDAKLARAKRLGAKHTINSAKENLAGRVKEITEDDGVNVAIEAVGLPQTFQDAVDVVCFAGRVVYIGYAKNPVEYQTKLFVSKEADIMGSRNAFAHEIDYVIGMFRSGTIDIGQLVTHRFSLDETDKALRLWQSSPAEVTKIILTA